MDSPPDLEPNAQRVQRLQAQVSPWVALGCSERAVLLRRCIETLAPCADSWICALPEQAPGELWLGDLWPLRRRLRLLAEAMDEQGRPALPQVRRLDPSCGGGFCVSLLPASALDRVMFYGLEASVRLRPQRQPTQGQTYRQKLAGEVVKGGVALVVAEGAQASEGVLDALQLLFARDEVVLLLLPARRRALIPVLSRALAPLVEQGCLAFGLGDAPLALSLAAQGGVSALHLSGGRWPTPRPPLPRVRLSCRARGPNPTLIVPGPWSAQDLRDKALALAGRLAWGGGACEAGPRQLVMASGWALFQPLLEQLRRALAGLPHPVQLPEPGQSAASGLTVLALDAQDAPQLFARVPGLWPEGGACCDLFVHPDTEKDHPELLRAALPTLPFGAVGLNSWSAQIFSLGLGWGAGAEGLPHSAQLLDHPEQVVLRGPFRPRMPSAWQRDAAVQQRLGRRLFDHERSSSWTDLPGLGLAAWR